MIKNRRNIFIYAAFLITLSVGLTVFMMPRERISEFTDYKIGMLAHENIAAPFDFEILRTDEELSDVRVKIGLTVSPVFIYIDTLNLHLYKKYTEFCSDIDKLYEIERKISARTTDSTYQLLSRNFIQEKAGFHNEYGLNYEDISVPPVIFDSELRKSIGNYLRSNLYSRFIDTPKRDIFNIRSGKFSLITQNDTTESSFNDFPDILNKEQKDNDFILSLIKSGNPDSVRNGKKILNTFSRPSLIYNRQVTDSLIKKFQNDVPLAEGLVKKGEIILSKNTVITENTLKILRSLDLKYKESGRIRTGSVLKNINFRAVSGKVIISSLFFFVLIMMLILNRKKYFYNYKYMTVLFLIINLQIVLSYISFRYIDGYSPYLVAMSVTSVLTAVFFDMRVSFVTTVVASVTISVMIGSNFLFIFIPLFSSLLTMYAVHKIRDIFQFIYKTMLFSFLGLVLPGIGFYLILGHPYEELFNIIYHSAITSAVSPLLALTLLTIIEKIFKIPTDITLLQLSDMSRPLLRKLQTEAPGTYHHSVTVGNLAEAAAEAIGANSLLARVGAYYHDIGKTFKAAFFIENQQGPVNRHDKIAPNMSAFILSAHVKEGVKLAYEHNLPEIIIDFIRSHHGASRMEYFYNKALTQSRNTDEKVNEQVYRYPGPKPNSKETAIVMISDIVEAKCRTESSANAERFRQIINEIILDKLQTGELDECDIKINDLRKIREAMIPVMTGMYHQRIKYPLKFTEKLDENNELKSENINEEK